MTISLKHKFTSAKADGSDTTEVQPSNWNDEHALTTAARVLVGRKTNSAGAVEELALNTGEARAYINKGKTVLTDAATTSADLSLNNYFTWTIGGNRTLAVSNPADGASYVFRIKQDGTGGRVVTWPAKFKWPGGVAGVLSTAANAVDVLTAVYDAVDDVYACVLQKAFA